MGNNKSSKVLKKRQAGFTLLEVSSVLIISAIIGGAIIATYTSVSEDQKVTGSASELELIRNNVASLYQEQGNFNGLSNAVLLNQKNLPAKWRTTTGLINPFSGDVQIAQYSDLAYSVQFQKIPQRACVKILTEQMPNDVEIILTQAGQQYSLNSSQSSSSGTADRISPSQALLACSSTINSITWVFGDTVASSSNSISISGPSGVSGNYPVTNSYHSSVPSTPPSSVNQYFKN